VVRVNGFAGFEADARVLQRHTSMVCPTLTDTIITHVKPLKVGVWINRKVAYTRRDSRSFALCLLRCIGTVLAFREISTLEDAIGFHTCSLEMSKRATKGIPLGFSLLYQLTL
jgi:hypothetical protein